MALAGYEGSEVGNKYPRSPERLHRALELRGLSIASAWFSAFLTVRPYEETAEAFRAHRDFLHEMGAKVIVVSEQGRSIQGQMDTPLFADKPVFTDSEWTTLAEGLGGLGRLAAEKGMTLVYHHHMGTGVQTAAEIARLMELTDSNEVSLLYDTGHLAFSGENPLEVLREHLPRIKHVHLKDIRPEVVERVKAENLSFLQAVKAGAFTVPGMAASRSERFLPNWLPRPIRDGSLLKRSRTRRWPIRWNMQSRRGGISGSIAVCSLRV